MKYSEFYKKLSPFFTAKQINNLNSIALDEAQTGISDPGEIIAFDSDKHAAGRDFVCLLLSDIAGEDGDSVARIEHFAGGAFTAESYNALCEQMDRKW